MKASRSAPRSEAPQFKIEKGLTVPKRRTFNNGYTDIMRKLKVGESVLLPIRRGLSSYAAYALGQGAYACRREGEGMRVWRTK